MKSSKKWIGVLVFLTILLCVYPLLTFFGITVSKSISDVFEYSLRNINIVVLTALFFAISLVYLKKAWHLVVALMLSVVLAYVLSKTIPIFFLYLGVFLPSLVHVYVFTLLFMLYGAKKGKSKIAYTSVLVLLLVPFVIYYLPINHETYTPSEGTMGTFMASSMNALSMYLANLFGGIENGKFYALSLVGIKAQIFIAFAYTYHYLNWFSKTSIIGWKKGMSTAKLTLIFLLSLGSISLYYYDYKTGLIALLFLSYLHVFLEFPLNVVSIKGLFSKGE